VTGRRSEAARLAKSTSSREREEVAKSQKKSGPLERETTRPRERRILRWRLGALRCRLEAHAGPQRRRCAVVVGVVLVGVGLVVVVVVIVDFVAPFPCRRLAKFGRQECCSGGVWPLCECE